MTSSLHRTNRLPIANYAQSAADEMRSFSDRYNFDAKVEVEIRHTNECRRECQSFQATLIGMDRVKENRRFLQMEIMAYS